MLFSINSEKFKKLSSKLITDAHFQIVARLLTKDTQVLLNTSMEMTISTKKLLKKLESKLIAQFAQADPEEIALI